MTRAWSSVSVLVLLGAACFVDKSLSTGSGDADADAGGTASTSAGPTTQATTSESTTGPATTDGTTASTDPATSESSDSVDATKGSDASSSDSETGGPGHVCEYEVFLTSGAWTGTQLGGIEGANALCDAARGAPEGAWQAVLADAASAPPMIGGVVCDLDGFLIADEWWSTEHAAAVLRTENETVVVPDGPNGEVYVWTASTSAATFNTTGGAGDCGSWGLGPSTSEETAVCGDAADHTGAAWVSTHHCRCDTPARLYCVAPVQR
jgi:hypothetical protein